MHRWIAHLAATLLAAAAPALAAEPGATPRPTQFSALDSDGDGRLTAAELQAARARQIARFDRDGDRRLSVDEYQAWWLDAAQPRLERQFRADDGDKDGQISLEELVARSADLLHRRDLDQDGTLTAQEWRPRRTARAGNT